MIPFIKEYLLNNWQNLNLGPAPKDLGFIKLGDRAVKDESLRTASFIVTKSETPVLIIKIPRDPANPYVQASLKLEDNNLKLIRDKLKGSKLLEAIPQSIFLEQINGTLVQAETTVSGTDMGKTYVSENIVKTAAENLTLAFDWLAEFQLAFGGTPQHGDFHASNLFVSKGNISGVIDWEDFKLDYPPCYDVFYFIKTYSEALYGFIDQAKNPALIQSLTFGDYPKICQQAINNYCQKVGIDPKTSGTFFPLYVEEALKIAASPRKKALGACKNLQILQKFQPLTLQKLFLVSALFSYTKIGAEAKAKETLDKLSNE